MNALTPKVVKFSGGRSSGMMLLEMLKNKELNPERGDVIIFNNTSAEHSATYSFVAKIKKIAERDFDIPFFLTEYTTYEDAGNNNLFTRKNAYKLVNEQPFSKDNPNGYCYKGEVFEQLVSKSGFLPDRSTRTCTQTMKIFVTNNFLADWFAQKQSIERLGHHHNKSMITDESIIQLHKKYKGKTPNDILLKKRAFIRSCRTYRPGQQFQDFTTANIVINNNVLRESVIGNKAQLYGDDCVDYISCLGIRADEKRRITKILKRIEDAENKKGKRFTQQTHGEQIYSPLIDGNVTQEDVTDFWKKQSFDLNLPHNGILSNCVFCPLKGPARLLEVAKIMEQETDPENPASINWWIGLEKKYSRDLKAENKSSKNNNKYIGFFSGQKQHIFESIKLKSQEIDISQVIDKTLNNINPMPCNCTD